MTTGPRVLLAEDEPHLGTILEAFLTGRGHVVTRVHDGRAALDALRAATYDVALLDVVMPEMDGLAVLSALGELPLPPEAVVMTGNGTVDTALHALRLGAYDYLTKPYRMAEVDVLVRRAAEKRALRIAAAAEAWTRARESRPAPESVHPPLQALLESAAASAREGRPPLLVVGETGTGRRSAARWLAGLARPGAPLLELCCTGSEPEDRESLLGVPGASDARLAGAFALASGGTLILADADRLDRATASALVGALRDDPRAPLVIATAREEWGSHGSDLARAFCERDRLTLPPLRARMVDISRLAVQSLPADALPRRIGADAEAVLVARDWPGNVAQLRHVVGAAAWNASGVVLRAADLEGSERAGGSGPTVAALHAATALSLAELEHRQIAAVLEEVGWHRGRAAERLGISPRTLYRKIREYGFDRPAG